MMRILTWGLTNNRAGTEAVICNIVDSLSDKACFDFLTFDPVPNHPIAYAEGNRVFEVPNKRMAYVRYEKAMRAFFEEHAGEYDAVWCNLNILNNIDTLRLGFEYGVPRRILHAHNSGNDGKPHQRVLSMINKRQFDRFVTDRWACSAEAGGYLFDGHPFEVVPNAIDMAKYAFNADGRKRVREELGLGGRFVIGAVGRLSKQKNPLFLLDVLALLLRVKPESSLVIVGEGELRDALEAKATLLGVADRVIFAGLRSDMPEMLSAFDVYVMPSLFEGLPVSLLEAQANGLPCIISDSISKEAIVSSAVFSLPLDSVVDWTAMLAAMPGERFRVDAHRASRFDLKGLGEHVYNLLSENCICNEYSRRSCGQSLPKKALIFADTPLQILNSIALASGPDFKDVDSDLMIYGQFDLGGLDIEAVKSQDVFSSVEVIENEPFKSKWNRRKRAYESLLKRRGSCPYIRNENKYDIFALSCPTVITNHLLRELKKRNPDLSVVMYEDGSGSYNGNVLRLLCYLDDLPEGVQRNGLKLEFQKKILRVLTPNSMRYNPRVFYLYRPDLATAHYPAIRALSIGDEVYQVLARVFRSSYNPPIGGAEVIIFDIPRTSQEGIDDVPDFDSVIRDIVALRGSVWLKRHPRTPPEDVGRSLSKEYPNEMWEIGCRRRDIKDWTLVSLASSAMLTPCIMYGIEPRLVFLFKYKEIAKRHANESCEAIYSTALALYSDTNRITCPKTREELKIALGNGAMRC